MFTTALTFFVILSLLVLVHELGHFLVAKIVGVRVEEFGLGLPPRAIGKKIKGTTYSLNWLPIGGFVRLLGEDEEETQKSKVPKQNLKQYFWARTKKERAAILLAGVTMNFLLAIVLTAYLLAQGVLVPSGRVHIEKVLPQTPAQRVGIKAGDIVVGLKLDSKLIEFKTPRELVETTKMHLGESVVVVILRDGKTISYTLVPRKDYPRGEGPIGIQISDLESKKYPLPEIPAAAVKINLVRAGEMLSSIGTMLWRLITLQPIRAEVAGPIGIAQVTGEAVKYGLKAVIEFMAILSLNLAVLNILPVPALDGGRLVFVFLEKLLGKRIRPAFEKSTHQIGMIILLALIALVSINDILRLARGG